MKVLVACEFSGRVRDAFRALGHDAYSCDFEPNDSPYHIQGDARVLLLEHWDLLIAHPPCTRLCKSGSRWLWERNLWADMRKGVDLFMSFLDADIPHIAIENPTMHHHAAELIDYPPAFCVQPWQFGHGETKRTCFWTVNLPPLQPTNIVSGRANRIHLVPQKIDRWKIKSETYIGIAQAMAEQWGAVNGIHQTPTD